MNKFKRFPFYTLSVFALLLSACYPFPSWFLAAPDRKDLQRFDASTVHAGDDCFEFPIAQQPHHPIKINDWTTDIPFFVSLDEFLPTHSVRSFLIIQHDSILYEYYGQGTEADDLHSSYSIAKSFTSALIGIAIEEASIESERELVVKYIPELGNAPEFQQLRIEHLLNHTSGIRYSLLQDAQIYYGKNTLKKLAKIEFEAMPGTKQHYLNINIHLLGLVLKRSTGMSPAQYLEEKIWQPIQMCSDAKWLVDEKNELEKTYCCLGATARDYAKFGRLFMQKGKWGGQQIVSEEWYKKSIRRDTTEGSSFNYNYCWYIGLKEYDDFMANGLYKQHIYVYPKKELIIVSLNNQEKRLKAERVNWWHVFRQIADQLPK